MINFRFHLVSLVAVFLAMGLGILVGSTVIDQKIVNRLDSEIASVSKENDKRQAESKQLAKQNSDQQQFVESVAPFVVDGRLDGQSVAIVAERGVDGGVVKKTETLLRGAGADVPAVLWLDDSWLLDTDQRKSDLQSALGLHGDETATRTRAFNLLARRLAKAPTTTVSSTSTSEPRSTTTLRSTPTTTPAPVDVLTELQDAGFLSVTDGNASELATFPSRVAHVLVITGDKSHFLGAGITSAFTRALERADLPTVVAAVYDAGSDPSTAPERGAALSSILDDRVLSKAVSTLDDLELEQGRVAATLALGWLPTAASGTTATAPTRRRRSRPIRREAREATIGRARRGRDGRRDRGVARRRLRACS